MLLATINIYCMYSFAGEPNSLAHLLMFIYCMMRGWETSKKDGIVI